MNGKEHYSKDFAKNLISRLIKNSIRPKKSLNIKAQIF